MRSRKNSVPHWTGGDHGRGEEGDILVSSPLPPRIPTLPAQLTDSRNVDGREVLKERGDLEQRER
jgi:hypothetical protein